MFAGGAIRPIVGEVDTIDFGNAWIYYFANPQNGWIDLIESLLFTSNHLASTNAFDSTGAEHYYFMGGQVGEDERTGNFDNLVEWIPQSLTFLNRAAMPITRGHAAESTRPYGCGFYTIAGSSNTGGGDGLGGRTSDASYYDIATDTWTKFGDLSLAINTPVCDTTTMGGDEWVVS